MTTQVEKRNIINWLRKINIEKLLEIICLSFVFLYFFYVMDVVDFNTSFRTYRGIIAGVAIARVFFAIAKKGTYRYLIFDVMFISMLGKVVYYCSSNTDKDNFCDIVVLGICLFGIDFRKSVKTMAIATMSSLFASFLCSFTSIVDSTIAREYSRTYGDITSVIIRSGWGCGHENLLGMRCFVAVSCFCLGFNHFSKVLRSLVAFAAAVFVWIVPNSRFNTYLLALLGLGLLIDYLHDKFFNNKRIFNILRKGTEIFTLVLALLMPILLVWIILNYEKVNPELLQKLDNLSSGRIYLGYNSYKINGFSLWGQGIDTEYYLDSGWLRIPITYGIIITVLVIALLIYGGYKAFVQDDFLLVWLTLLISISGVCYELYIYPFYNAILIFPFTNYIEQRTGEDSPRESDLGNIQRALYKNRVLICWILVLAVMAIFRKGIASTLQTLVECKKYTPIGGFAWILALIVMLALLVMGISGLGKSIIMHTKKTVSIGLILISCLGILSIFTYSWHYINNLTVASSAYAEVIADSDAMQIIDKIENVEVVPQIKPYLYKKYYGFTDLKWLPTADYARFENVTVIVDTMADYRTLNNTGFAQFAISDYHKIYTNDSRVIEAMEAAGYGSNN